MTEATGPEPVEAEADEVTAPRRGRPPKVDQFAINEELRKKAARQAAKVAEEMQAPTMVECRVLKMGDGKVSTGQHVAGIGEVHYDKGEVFKVERSIAEALEARGFIEIQ